MATLAANLPYHVYGYVDKAHLSDGAVLGWEPAVWFGVTLPTNRALGLTVLLENGAVYRELPPHAWAFTPSAPPWTIGQAQAWDCFGGSAQLLEYAYLRELAVRVEATGDTGTYLCTLEFGDNGFSRYPPQSKCLHLVELDHGRLTLQPNNHLRWSEASFTHLDKPVDWLRRQSTVWGAETWPASGTR